MHQEALRTSLVQVVMVLDAATQHTTAHNHNGKYKFRKETYTETRKDVGTNYQHDTQPSVMLPSVSCSGTDSKLGLTMA